MKMALAVITYDRAHYLSVVLPSILGQTIDGRPVHEYFDIYVFQDGFCHEDIRSSADGHRQVAEILQRLPEHVQTLHQAENLGVALHFDFIEKLLFREKKYDFVLFCEDDLVLSPRYASVIWKMAYGFRGDNRVGMVSAHPSNPARSMADQEERLHDYTEIGHNWGFGLFREFWERRQPFVELYLNLIRDVPYRSRPTPAVLRWLEMCGFKPSGSSQDYVKQCATVALGAARVSTVPNFALPIGRSGLHCSPDLFERLGFTNVLVCELEIDQPGELTNERFQQILRAQKRACFLTNSFPAPGTWRKLVRTGQVDPRKLLAGTATESPQSEPPARSWSSADIPRKPHMEPEGLELLTSLLSSGNCFLEYGAGGSTVLAAELGVATIYSVESDRSFLEAVKAAVAEAASGTTLIGHYVDIGPTAEWGNPKDSSKAASWPLYPSSIWSRILANGSPRPEVVLIDGRFRVACFLAALMFSKPGTRILFDDYYDRPHYHVVENYLEPINGCGRMAEFRTQDPPPTTAMLDLMAYSTIFD